MMREIDRKIFASLNEDKGTYYILIDGYFEAKFSAINDTEAKEKFHLWCDKKQLD